jgi:hypothetical protein
MIPIEIIKYIFDKDKYSGKEYLSLKDFYKFIKHQQNKYHSECSDKEVRVEIEHYELENNEIMLDDELNDDQKELMNIAEPYFDKKRKFINSNDGDEYIGTLSCPWNDKFYLPKQKIITKKIKYN